MHYTASWTAGASAGPEPNGEDDLGEKKAMETVVQDVIAPWLSRLGKAGR